MANSFTFDGVSFNQSTYGNVILLKGADLGAPDLDFTKIPLGLADGSIYGPGRYTDKTMKLVAVITGTNVDNLYARMNSILAIIGREKGTLTIDYLPNKQTTVKLNKLNHEIKSKTMMYLTLEFSAADPFWYATNETVENVTINNNYIYSTGVVAGSVEVSPVFTLHNTYGTTSHIYLENEYRHESISYDHPLTVGQYLKIDSENQTIETSSDGLDWSNCIRYATVSDFPKLSIGVNSIRIQGISSGNLEIRYRAKFL